MKETYCYYVRVSSSDQEEKRTYENQIIEIKKYSKENKLKLSNEFRDVMTGKKYNRPQFINMMNTIHEYKGVVIAFIDRLGRDFVEQMRVFVKLYDTGTDLHVVDFGNVDFKSLDDQFKYVLESWFGAKENERHSKRVKGGIARFIKEHKRWGRLPIEIDWDKYDTLKKAKITNTDIAKILKVSRTTLYSKVKKRNEKEK